MKTDRRSRFYARAAIAGKAETVDAKELVIAEDDPNGGGKRPGKICVFRAAEEQEQAHHKANKPGTERVKALLYPTKERAAELLKAFEGAGEADLKRARDLKLVPVGSAPYTAHVSFAVIRINSGRWTGLVQGAVDALDQIHDPRPASEPPCRHTLPGPRATVSAARPF